MDETETNASISRELIDKKIAYPATQRNPKTTVCVSNAYHEPGRLLGAGRIGTADGPTDESSALSELLMRKRSRFRTHKRLAPAREHVILDASEVSESPVKNVEAIDILGCLVWHQYSRLQGCAAGPAETLQIGAPVEAGRAA